MKDSLEVAVVSPKANYYTCKILVFMLMKLHIEN